MTTHITARLAWHDDGWNGRICRRPACNTYCVGSHSFPGDLIARERNVTLEEEHAGQAVSRLRNRDLPPCIYSINAFGSEPITGYSNPPDFLSDGARRTEWDIPPASVCVWPYEAMYADNVRSEGGRLDNDQRSANAEQFFREIENDRSLIFYYANYSNPFSEEESSRYAVIGVSRVKTVGDRLVYADANEYVRENYAGGLIWARRVSTHYPDEGFRIPYHVYRDDPDVMGRIGVFPENPRTCKYGSRHITDDEAIGLLEQLRGTIEELRSIGDQTEDWDERERWLLACIGELWTKRGLYPGLLNVMRFLGADQATVPARSMIERRESRKAHELFFKAVENVETPELGLSGRALMRVSRKWQLQPEASRALLRSVVSRVDLDVRQIDHIVSENTNDRSAHGLADSSALVANPYRLSEGYVGEDPDDVISWATVDRAVLPSPDLGGQPLAEMETDDPRRLRSLCVEQLRRERNQTFRPASEVVDEVNGRLAKLPQWKRATFSLRHFEVDCDELSEALVQREDNGRLWLYMRDIYDDERAVEDALTRMAGRPAIALERPFSVADWRQEIYEPNSPLLRTARDEYETAVKRQADACGSVLRQPLAVVTGPAGSGKTSVICALIRAVRRTEGDGATVTVLAPTGKASDRVRSGLERRGIERVATSTVHSFLATNGWLNKNLTLKRRDGRRAGIGTIVIDEASMLDLGLLAALVRALDWRQIRRFVLVGDRNQLPPIGRGRVFADLVDWLSATAQQKVVHLTDNLRQMENRAANRGTAVLEVAELFIGQNARRNGNPTSGEDEELIARIHRGGEVDKDLHVVYWHDGAALADVLIRTIEADMERRTGSKSDVERPYELWRAAFGDDPATYQVITPHRGKLHGVEALNAAIQRRVASRLISRYGSLEGVTLGDKVIQYRNRTRSNPIWAYNHRTRSTERVEVFNGEIGFVHRHNFDRGSRQRLKRIQVRFERKEELAVGYGSYLGTRGGSERVEENLELAYAISVHKAQGSEFLHTYVVIPRADSRALSSELVYTALTRATQGCTLLVEGDVSTLLSARRPENAQRELVNSSLFEGRTRTVPDALSNRKDWYAEGRVHKSLGGEMVRSKSELVIANILHDNDVPFEYEVPLRAGDGTMYLPDFTITWDGGRWFWEHWGMMSSAGYRAHRDKKVAWYQEHFPGRLIETFEGRDLSEQAATRVAECFRL